MDYPIPACVANAILRLASQQSNRLALPVEIPHTGVSVQMGKEGTERTNGYK